MIYMGFSVRWEKAGKSIRHVKIEILTRDKMIKEGGGNWEIIESVECSSIKCWSLLEILKLEDG